MKSKTAQRILEETPQEAKDKVKALTNRELELLQMGFRYNEHQLEYELSKYDSTWYVDFWKLSDYTDHKWNILIEDIKYDLEMVKKQYYDDLKQHPAYSFAVKEKNKQIKDKINALKSKLAEEKRQKLTKIINQERVKELEVQIKILQELL